MGLRMIEERKASGEKLKLMKESGSEKMNKWNNSKWKQGDEPRKSL